MRWEIPQVETSRLLLRAFELRDFEAFVAHTSDPAVMRYIGDGRTFDRPTAWRGMSAMIGHWALRGFGFWALEEKSTGAWVGRAGLLQAEGWPGLEVGWSLDVSAWGRGLATEAAQASLDFARDVVKAPHVCSLILPENAPSIRVALRLGEKFERTDLVLGQSVSVYGITF